MLVLCLVAGCLVTPGQPSTAKSITKAAGESVNLEVRQDSTGTLSTTLKWEIIFPAQLMEMEGGSPKIGSEAAAAGKSVQCNRIKPYSYACILFGGGKPVPNGALAEFSFKILPNAAAGKTTLRLERAEGTNAESVPTALNEAEVTVTVR